jgi:hypothetical protein
MKAFLKAVWERVALSYKSTLVGLGAGIGLVLVDQFVLYVAGDVGASPYLKAAAAIAAMIGAALRSKALPPATP